MSTLFAFIDHQRLLSADKPLNDPYTSEELQTSYEFIHPKIKPNSLTIPKKESLLENLSLFNEYKGTSSNLEKNLLAEVKKDDSTIADQKKLTSDMGIIPTKSPKR